MPENPKEAIRLTVIDEPAQGTRSVLSCDQQEPAVMLTGSYTSASDLACGMCGTVLVRQMLLSQFESPERASGEHLFQVALGEHHVAIPKEMLTTILTSENGPLVLRCPRCRQYNEVRPAP